MNLLYVLFTLDMLNLAVFLPAFNPFIRSLGGTPISLGVINSSSALVSLLWNPVVGSLSDQVGRKGLLIKCLIASAIGSVVMASSSSLIIVFIGKLIGSLGSAVGILLRSIVADKYKTAEEKKSFFNKCAPFMSSAFLVGSLSSGFLSEAKNGFSLAFLLMASIMGIASIVAKGSLANDSKESKSRKTKNKKSIISKGLHEIKKATLNVIQISWPRYRNIFIIKGCYDFALGMITANLGFILLNEFQIQGRYMGYVFLMISVVSIAANILKLKLKTFFDGITDHQMLIKGGLLLVTTFVGMSVPSPVYVFLFFLTSMCIARAFLDTTFTEMITTATTEEDRGKVIGAYENLVPLSGIIAPILSGLLAEAFGERVLIISAAVPMSMALLLAHWQKNKND